jgi:hypothetical protein
MEVSPEVQAAIVKVSGDWARYLATVDPRHQKRALERLIKRYKGIHETLQLIHRTQFKT